MVRTTVYMYGWVVVLGLFFHTSVFSQISHAPSEKIKLSREVGIVVMDPQVRKYVLELTQGKFSFLDIFQKVNGSQTEIALIFKGEESMGTGVALVVRSVVSDNKVVGTPIEHVLEPQPLFNFFKEKSYEGVSIDPQDREALKIVLSPPFEEGLNKIRASQKLTPQTQLVFRGGVFYSGGQFVYVGMECVNPSAYAVSYVSVATRQVVLGKIFNKSRIVEILKKKGVSFEEQLPQKSSERLAERLSLACYEMYSISQEEGVLAKWSFILEEGKIIENINKELERSGKKDVVIDSDSQAFKDLMREVRGSHTAFANGLGNYFEQALSFRPRIVELFKRILSESLRKK